MISLPPPYHLIQTTLDMELNMNSRQRRAARRKAEREAMGWASQAERIEADESTDRTWLKAAGVAALMAILAVTITFIAVR